MTEVEVDQHHYDDEGVFNVKWWERAWRLWVPLTIFLSCLSLVLVGVVIVATLRQSAQQTACARRLAAAVTDADHEWFDAASAVLGGQFPDRAAVQERFLAVRARQAAAVQKQKTYAAHPTHNCPVSPEALIATTTTGSVVPTTTVPPSTPTT